MLIALTDMAGLNDPAQKGAFATEAAQRIGSEIKTGKDVYAALGSVLGEGAPVDELIQKAREVPAYDRIGTDEDESKIKVRAPGDTTMAERKGNFFTDFYSGGAGSLSAAAQALGQDEWADYFGEIAEEYAPPITSYKDVDNFGEGIRYLSAGIAQSLGEMLAVGGRVSGRGRDPGGSSGGAHRHWPEHALQRGPSRAAARRRGRRGYRLCPGLGRGYRHGCARCDGARQGWR